jgi:adenylate cyclase class IV
MEVEIKLRLPDAAAHRRLSSFLAPRLVRTHAQRNLFFDAAARTLAAATAALRVRLYADGDGDGGGGGGGDGDRAPPSRAVLALKRRPRLDAGVSRVEEVEEPLDPALALACAADPARLGGVDSPIVRLVAAEYGVGGAAAPFVCLGGFRNTRAVYELEDEGLVLELDETRFDFGTSYELECETPEPDRVKEVLERLLTVAGVPYEYSRSNKFGCFMAGKLLP